MSLRRGPLANGSQLVTAANLFGAAQARRDDRRGPMTGRLGVRWTAELVARSSATRRRPGRAITAICMPFRPPRWERCCSPTRPGGCTMRGPFMRRLLEVMYDGKPEAVGDARSSRSGVRGGRRRNAREAVHAVPEVNHHSACSRLSRIPIWEAWLSPGKARLSSSGPRRGKVGPRVAEPGQDAVAGHHSHWMASIS